MSNHSSESNCLRVLITAQNDEQKQEWFDLPIGDDQLCGVFTRLGIKGPEDFRIEAVSGPYGSLTTYLSGSGNLDGLNMLATFFLDMEDWEMKKLCAVTKLDLAEYGDPLDVLLNVVGSEDNFTGFDLIGAHNEEELGRYWAREEPFDAPPDFDYAAYGRENMEDGGVFTDWGYIRVKFQPTMQFDSRSLPEEYCVVDRALQTIVDRACPPVYPYSADEARQRNESELYRESNRKNTACAQAIDREIQASNYEPYRYDLVAAAKTVIDEYGPDRVAWVLANVVRKIDFDGRISQAHKDWAQEQAIPEDYKSDLYLSSHPAVLDSFIRYARQEIDNHLRTAEMSTEQNYNMLDGRLNNQPAPRADLTDGQTHEEIRELASETLQEKKPSLLDQIRRYKENPPEHAPTHHSSHDDHER